MEAEIIVDVDGTARFIYDDELAAGLAVLGAASVARASHVEPSGAAWVADMAPVGGPALPACSTRREALAREVEWLRAHNIPRPL